MPSLLHVEFLAHSEARGEFRPPQQFRHHLRLQNTVCAIWHMQVVSIRSRKPVWAVWANWDWRVWVKWSEEAEWGSALRTGRWSTGQRGLQTQQRVWLSVLWGWEATSSAAEWVTLELEFEFYRDVMQMKDLWAKIRSLMRPWPDLQFYACFLYCNERDQKNNKIKWKKLKSLDILSSVSLKRE